MHLNDALACQKRIQYVCNHHEQAAVMAAEGYSRVTGRMGVACVTTGPGGTHAITGVMGAWVDSIPLFVISGQVKLETTVLRCPSLRQLGDQEINIVDIVRPITKAAVIVTDKNDIAYHLNKALYIATSGRPGPVWLDIPLDIQGAMIDRDDLKEFDPGEVEAYYDQDQVSLQINTLMTKLKQSKRPVVIVGNDVRLAHAIETLADVLEQLSIPVLTTISGIDLVPSDSPLFFGRPGILGERCANFVLQNSDLVIIIGTRMNIRQIGYAFETFAREAFKVGVDIDENELHNPTLKYDLPIHSDCGFFLEVLQKKLVEAHVGPLVRSHWYNYCQTRKRNYPVVLPEHREGSDYVNSYYFAEALSKHLKDDSVVVTGNGTAYTSTYQSLQIKQGQRVFANVGCASMGYDLPAAIGACFARNGGDVVCVTGDGSIQMNLQELQTIVNYKLPIKIFMFNNEGYLSIKTTQ